MVYTMCCISSRVRWEALFVDRTNLTAVFAMTDETIQSTSTSDWDDIFNKHMRYRGYLEAIR